MAGSHGGQRWASSPGKLNKGVNRVKATPLAKFRINGSGIARMNWGEVNESYRTNRHGAYYCSCSGHGGYVVDSRCLSDKERRKINRYILPYNLRLFIQHRSDGDYVIGVNAGELQAQGPFRQRYYRYSPHLGGIEWIDLPVYLFEEDCDWAILEKLTDIRSNGLEHLSDSKRRYYINRTFKQWCKPLAVKN